MTCSRACVLCDTLMYLWNVCKYVRVYMSVCNICMCVCNIRVYVCTKYAIRMHVCMHVYMCVCMYYLCVYVIYVCM